MVIGMSDLNQSVLDIANRFDGLNILNQAIQLTSRFCSDERYHHVLRVVNMSALLSQHYECESLSILLAAALHDLAKELNPSRLLELGVDASDIKSALFDTYPKVWHAFVGPILAQSYLGDLGEDVWGPMRYHCTGKDNMSLAEQLVFVADYIEPGRRRPNQSELEQMAKQDLRQVILLSIEDTVAKCQQYRFEMHPDSLACQAYYQRHLSR